MHLIWLRALVLLDLGTSPTDLKKVGPTFQYSWGHSICGIVSVFGVYHLSLFLG